MNEIRIPATGYGFSFREYGECLDGVVNSHAVHGKSFLARLEPAVCEKEDCSHQEPDISDYGCSLGATDLVLREVEKECTV